ncbi:MAG: isoprenyl transferase [Vampirovibrio sp.]|nr:isoprenyl transferase [Vampirovibrio sp.]
MATSCEPNTAGLDADKITMSEMQQCIRDINLRHIAIIMDGNRRWAKEKHLPKELGHKQGVDALKNIVQYASDIGLDALTVYAFSTENWSREKPEVGYLLKLFLQALSRELEDLHRNQVRIQFIGDLTPFPEELRQMLQTSMEKTSENNGLTFQVAINYGSRAELTRAAKILAQQVKEGELEPEEITETQIQKQLYTHAVPDPDLLIRTGGESRWSNYLLWQCAYAEFYVTEKLWPEFSLTEFNQAILEYQNRERRYGK